jgi:broad specificity phosphatase PhoE
MTTIYLVRHGEYENPQYLFPGRSMEGFPLSPKGRAQVEGRANSFVDKHIIALYSSPILRTRQTAEIFSRILSLPVTYDERILEVKTMGEGLSMKDFDATRGELSYTPQFQAKGAESLEQLADRMQGFMEEKRVAHKGEAIVVISHGDPICMTVMRYKGMPMDFPTTRTVPVPLAGGYAIQFFDDGQLSSVTQLPTI